MNESCPDCERAEADIYSPRYTFGCRECNARQLAHGPQFFESIRSNTITPTYRACLQYLAGNDWKELHERVKHYSERIKTEARFA